VTNTEETNLLREGQAALLFCSSDATQPARLLHDELDGLGASTVLIPQDLEGSRSLTAIANCTPPSYFLLSSQFLKLLETRPSDEPAKRALGVHLWIPIWHRLSAHELRAISPQLADRPGLSTADGASQLARVLVRIRDSVLSDALEHQPVGVLPVIHEATCPRCKNPAIHLGLGAFCCDGGCGLTFDYSTV
jgi:hypothetical protein